MRNTMEKHRRLIVALLFAAMLVVGLFAAQGRPLAGDERMENITLSSNIKAYVQLFGLDEGPLGETLADTPDIATWVDRDYGQARSYWAWPLMQLADTQRGAQNIYHYHVYASFVLGLFALYCIVKRLTGRWGWGLAAVGLMYLNPRLFGEAFYNNKDIMLLALCLVVFWLGLAFIEKDTWASCVWFGVAGAFAANSRMIGLEAWGLIGILYLVWLTLEHKWSRRAFLRGVVAVAVFFVTFFVITPACWSDFIGYWQYYLGSTSNFDAARWNNWVLYRGAVYNPTENPIPWHYIPWFMAITTPLLVLALAALWPVQLVLHCRGDKQKWLSTETVFSLALAVFFAAPLLYAMAARPNLYNSWRHLYFIYAPVVVFAAVSAWWLWQSRRAWVRGAVCGALAVNFIYYAGVIAVNHPTEFAYFNLLAGPHPEERYDADYWNIGQATLMADMLELDPAFSAVPRQDSGLVGWNWYAIKDTMPQQFTEQNEEVKWDRRGRARYVLENTSSWHADLLHPTWDVNDPEVIAWNQAMEAQQPIYQLKCGRTVLWNVYENPQYNG